MRESGEGEDGNPLLVWFSTHLVRSHAPFDCPLNVSLSDIFYIEDSFFVWVFSIQRVQDQFFVVCVCGGGGGTPPVIPLPSWLQRVIWYPINNSKERLLRLSLVWDKIFNRREPNLSKPVMYSNSFLQINSMVFYIFSTCLSLVFNDLVSSMKYFFFWISGNTLFYSFLGKIIIFVYLNTLKYPILEQGNTSIPFSSWSSLTYAVIAGYWRAFDNNTS